MKASDEWMMKVVGKELQVGETKKEYKKRVEKERKECFLEKRLHGKYMRDVGEVANDMSWQVIWEREQKGLCLLLRSKL